jgi:hypothetical protein
MKKRADDADIAWRTIERAKNKLGVLSRKTGKHWCLELPSGAVESAEIKTANHSRPEASTPVNTGENEATPPESPKKVFQNEGLCSLSGEVFRHVWSTVGGVGGAFSFRDR